MPYLFTSESVSEGHPDKVADQISDALIDYFLAYDPNSKVACETLVTTGQVVLAGEVKSDAYLDVQEIVREVIRKIGYTKSAYMFEAHSCGIFSAIHEQSPDINQGVERKKKEDQGAGDQGMMFGYANNETDNFMPLALELAHLLLQELAAIRKEGKVMTYLRPDSKSQVTIEYSDDNKPLRIDTIVLSTQHDDFAADGVMLKKIRQDVVDILIPRVKKKLPKRIQKLFVDNIQYHINPTGKFVIGGPHGDTGLTGRKIIVDTYGGKGAHGGGAFSGKDPSKVDRSAAYATRHIAKNMVAAGLCDEVLVQVAYGIGRARPPLRERFRHRGAARRLAAMARGDAAAAREVREVGTDGAIGEKIGKIFDLRPYFIEKRFNLRSPIYSETAAYGHMGRAPQIVEKVFNKGKDNQLKVKVELFPWEKLDHVDILKKAFKV